MKWIPVDTQDDLAKLDASVCWEDSESLEFHGTIRNDDSFPPDIHRSGYENKNIRILIRACSGPAPYLEVLLIDCDYYSSAFLDHPFMSGKVDVLKRVEIEERKGVMAMRCSRLLYRFLSEEEVTEGRQYGSRFRPVE